MRILLVRHAEAVGPNRAPSDALRWLTPRGRETMRAVTGALAEQGLRWTQVLTSPLVRAVQTAEILASPPWFDGEVAVHGPLAPDDGTTAQALAPLETLADADAVVALVGHEPRIRVLAGHLLGVDAFPAFRSGGVALVRWVPGAAGELQWRLDPDERRPVTGMGGPV